MTEAHSQSNRPGAPRRRMIWAGIMLAVFSLIVTHAFWGWSSRAKVGSLLKAYKLRGDPATIEGLNPPPVPDAENAALDWMSAAAVTMVNAPGWIAYDRQDRRESTRAQTEEVVGAVTRENAPALEWVDRATTRPAVDWQVKWKSPGVLVAFPSLSPTRQTGNLLWAATIDAHHRGDDVKAIQRVRQMHKLARDVQRMPSVMVTYLVSVGLSALGNDALENITPDLQVESAEVRSSVAELITILLDDAAWNEALRRTFKAERVMLADLAETFVSGKVSWGQVMTAKAVPPSPVLAYAAKPLVYSDTRQSLRVMTEAMEACAAMDWPTAQVKIDACEASLDRSIPLHIWAATCMPSLERFSRTAYRGATERHLGATALAIRLYQYDHAGERPAKLDELVPAYLPAVPCDPMAANGPGLRYVPGGPDPVLYSVGTDGVDGGGSDAPMRAGRTPPVGCWDRLDVVTHLAHGPAPAMQPSGGGAGSTQPASAK